MTGASNDLSTPDSRIMDRTFVHPKTGKPTQMNTAAIGKQPVAPFDPVQADRAASAPDGRRRSASGLTFDAR